MLNLELENSTPTQPTLEAPLQPTHIIEPNAPCLTPQQPSYSAPAIPTQPQSSLRAPAQSSFSHEVFLPPQQPSIGAQTRPCCSEASPAASAEAEAPNSSTRKNTGH